MRPFDGPRDAGLRHDFNDDVTGATRDCKYPMPTPCATVTRASQPSTDQSALVATECREDVRERRVAGEESSVNIVNDMSFYCVRVCERVGVCVRERECVCGYVRRKG